MRRLGNLFLLAINLGVAAVIGHGFDDISAPPLMLTTVIWGVLVLDALSYALHRAQHAAAALWYCHKLHHSDKAVDITTAVRNHPFEGIIAAVFVWLTATAFHIPAEVVGVYGAIAFITMVATHTDRPWPRSIERVLAPAIITRTMHLLHHSADPTEADTNFGNIFSWWDRIFGTLARGRVPERFGV